MILKFDPRRFSELLSLWSLENFLFVPDRNGMFAPFREFKDSDFHHVPVWKGIKEFVFPPRNFAAGGGGSPDKPVILAGARSCDLRALIYVYDRVFTEQDPVDTVYRSLRENLLIVTSDCRMPSDTCFCYAAGGKPYVTSGSDINLAFIDGGCCLAEALTEKGEKLLEILPGAPASEEDIELRKESRYTALTRVSGNCSIIFDRDQPGEKVDAAADKDYWVKASETCIRCGGCNFSCPTCYCSILNEVSSKSRFRKAMQWDSCQFKGYARAAGGLNPRKEMWQSFRYRYLCKFSLMPDEFGISGCTGCGRCISACPGAIDIRKTLTGLYGRA